jgi:hypothetical protein
MEAKKESRFDNSRAQREKKTPATDWSALDTIPVGAEDYPPSPLRSILPNKVA